MRLRSVNEGTGVVKPPGNNEDMKTQCWEHTFPKLYAKERRFILVWLPRLEVGPIGGNSKLRKKVRVTFDALHSSSHRGI